MSGPSGAEFEPAIIEIDYAAEPVDDDDAIAPRRDRPDWWRTPSNVYLIAIAVLVVAVVAAYQLGAHHRRTAAASPAPSQSVSPSASDSPPLNRVNPVGETGKQCASQPGPQRLQLGIEIVNQTTGPVTLMSMTPKLPLGGLRQTAQAAGTCGQLSLSTGIAGDSLAAGASTWITATFDVLVDCPQPLPVEFDLVVAVAGSTTATIAVGGFNDLGSVTYSSCGSS